MAFRSFHDVAVEVLLRASERAAKRAEIKGGEPTREESAGSPARDAYAQAARSSDKRAGSAGELARPSTGRAQQGVAARTPDEHRMAPASAQRAKLELVDKGMRSVCRQSGFPNPALRRPVLIVVEGGHPIGP